MVFFYPFIGGDPNISHGAWRYRLYFYAQNMLMALKAARKITADRL
nr:MAG TPA: hypothetical protein [Caudoviricetes sp.]